MVRGGWAMGDNSYKGYHRVVLNNREEMTISGVMDVISFDEQLIVIETEMGILEIKGEDIHVNQLNLENGDLNLTGVIEGIDYDDKTSYKKGGKSLLNRLFG